ncbi:MAG: hypothetical protein IKV61_03955 [Clostridia bacterium]|nr:hypothetical protein [Clostridia bacterium]
MAKNRIFVNKEYEKAFNSICELIKGDCFRGLGWKVNGDIIDDGIYEYQLTSVYSQEREKVKHGFSDDGATWFKALRGQEVNNNDAIWTSFIETAGVEYHKRYSVVEYQQKNRTRDEKEKEFENNKKTIEQFTELFFPEFHQRTELKEVSGEGIKEDIYGVSMRIELSGGTGASLPVLCKVYFSKSGRTVTPITSFAAQEIDLNLSEIIPEESIEESVLSGESAIDTTLNAVDRLINNSESNFADYLCYSDKSDKLAVKNLLAQLSHNEIKLECQRVDVLYITHIATTTFLYDVFHMGKPLFRLSTGLNKSLTLSCLNCGAEEKLVESNVITYEKNGVEQVAMLSLGLKNFGLTEEQIEDIKNFSKLKEHYLHVSCPLAHRGQDCSTVKCKSQLFDADNSSGVLYKCKDCPYPEIVYTSLTGEKKYTPFMIFAKDAMTLLDAKSEELKPVKCNNCGRYFTSRAMKNKNCTICSEANVSMGTESQKALYKKYKNLLPIGARVLVKNSTKFCLEDEEVIIFVVGTKQYMLNKLNVKENGYFDKPTRIR